MKITGFLILILTAFSALAGEMNLLTYSGRILKPDNTPVEASSVNFTIKILSPEPGRCLLWEEQQAVNMTDSDGVFSIEIGKSIHRTSGLTQLSSAFQNSGTFSSLTCASGTSFTPTPNDDRLMVVSFNDGSGTQSLNEMKIKSVPHAMYADKAGEAMKVSGVEVSTNTPANGQALIYNSATSKWEPQNVANGTNVPSALSPPAVGQDGQSLRWNNTTGQWEWFTPGVAGAGITTVNGQGGSAQSFNVTSTGTDFTINSGSNIHNFNMPSASATARGVLTSTDWTTFNNKQAAGNYMTALTGDVVASGPGSAAATITNDAVNSAKILDGSVSVADLNFAGAMAVNTGLLVRNGTQFFNKSCAGNETLIWSVANGWICSAVVLTESDPGVSSWAKNASLQATDVPNLDAAKITTGTLGTARLGSGTADSTKYLRGDSTWQTLPSGADHLGNHIATQNLDLSTFKLVGNGGTAGINIDASGNVGIGISAPSNNLTVYSTTSAYGLTIDGTTNPAISLKENGTIRGYIGVPTGGGGFITGSSAGDIAITSSGGNIHMSTNGVAGSYLTVNSTGNVGIGTVGPNSKLEVAGVIHSTSGGIKFPDGTTQTTAASGGGGGESITALTDSATISVAAATARNFSVTLGGNRTMANPTGLVAGAHYRFIVNQDATGGRALTWDTNYRFPSSVNKGYSLINPSSGTIISNITNGTAAHIFDGNTVQLDASCPYVGSGDGYAGKDWGAGSTKTVTRFAIWGSQDYHLQNRANGNVRIKLQGSSDNSVWVDLYNSGCVNDEGYVERNVTDGIDTSTAYRYHRVMNQSCGGNGSKRFVEVQFYESAANFVIGPSGYNIISQAAGTAIGTMTSVGGLAAAFDSNTAQSDGAASLSSSGAGCVGKDWGAGITRTITKAVLWGSSDYGFNNPGGNGPGTVMVQGSSDGTNWITLYQTSTSSFSLTATNFDVTKPYRYHRACVSGQGTARFAEVVFYEGNNKDSAIYQFFSDGTSMFYLNHQSGY